MKNVIVIGAGHNGLVAAYYLARGGLEPIVLERRDEVGGGAIEGEFHTGFSGPLLSHEARLHEQIVRELQLEQHGLELVRGEPDVCGLAPSSPPLVLGGTNEAARSPQGISAGEAFETSEGRVHRAYNLGTVDAIEYNMFVGPPGRPIGVNIPNNEHRCGPPSRVTECRDGGWSTFNHPAPFANQGACIAYVNNRKRITLLVPEDPIP